MRDKTSYHQLTLLTNNYFHNNKFNIVITQHQAWVRNIKDSDFRNLLMKHILLYRNIAISCINIDVRIVEKYRGSPMHRYIVSALDWIDDNASHCAKPPGKSLQG